MKGLGNATQAVITEVSEQFMGQRVDNFLLRHLKGVPRSHVYRLVRGGEVRVNSRRVDPTYRLQSGDRVRIPPVRTATSSIRKPPAARDSGLPVIFEDDAILVIDKPAGLAVHGGSGISFGVIERMRAARPELHYLELVHRLDRETSGLLMMAKMRSALIALHSAWRQGGVEKTYLTLVKGRWHNGERIIDLPLHKYLSRDGERRVSVDRTGGKTALTRFAPTIASDAASLLRASLETGRTHQIRVHLAHIGFPILGDEKYGDFELNKKLYKLGLRRMFLHAARLRLAHPLTTTPLELNAALPLELDTFKSRMFATPPDAKAL